MGDGMRARIAGPAALGSLLPSVLLGVMVATAQDASPPPAPAAPTGEIISLGADAEAYRDDFGTPGTWAVGDHGTGRIEYLGGGLRFTTTTAPDARWDWIDLALGSPALWARVTVDLRSEGGAGGPMCGVTTSPLLLYFGVVNTAGEWVVGRTQETAVTVVERGPLPASIDLTRGGGAIVAIECAVTGPSGSRIALWVDGVNVADVSPTDPVASYFGPGLYGEGYVDGFDVTMDDLVVAVGAAYEPMTRAPLGQPPVAPETPVPATEPPVASAAPATTTPASETTSPAPPAVVVPASPGAVASGEVLSHVPTAFRDNCQPSENDPANGLLDAVTCSPAGAVATALYFLYDDAETVDAAFEGLLASRGAVTDGTDCSVGPALTDYTIGGQSAGRLACFAQDDLAVALWTHRGLRIMALGFTRDADFAGLYDWWATQAGPVE